MKSIYKTQEIPEKIEEVNKEFSIVLNNVEWIGVLIRTTKQAMMFLIDNFQSCCEEYAVYLENLFNINLIGSTIIDINWIEDISEEWLSSIKLELITDKGKVYIHMYNNHNGYYPHSYKILTSNYKNTGEL